MEADVTYVGRKPFTKVKSGAGHMNPMLALVNATAGCGLPTCRTCAPQSPYGARQSRLARSHFMTDEASAFKEIGHNFASHGTVTHTKDEYVRRVGDWVITTNTVEGFFSILKRGIYGVYQHVSEAHLHRYLAEFDFRYSNREKLGVNDIARASLALKGAKGRRLTYQTTGQ